MSAVLEETLKVGLTSMSVVFMIMVGLYFLIKVMVNKKV